MTLRALHSDDMAFIEGLYAGSRADEMSRSGWPAEQIAAFLTQQFTIQHAYYQTHYPDGEFLIVEHQGLPVGRLYLFWGQTSLNLIDINLLSEYQGQGIGSALIEELLHRVFECGLGVNLATSLVTVSGGNTPIDLRSLFLAMSFVIATQGIYLTRDLPR